MTLEHAMSQMDPQNSKFFPLYILLMSFFFYIFMIAFQSVWKFKANKKLL